MESLNLIINYLIRKFSCYSFFLDKLEILGGKLNHKPPSINFLYCSKNSKVCVIKTLYNYVKVTKQGKIDGKRIQSLIRTLNSHMSAVKNKIAGWVKTRINNANIDTDKFTAPSTRSVSPSKGELSELSLSET